MTHQPIWFTSPPDNAGLYWGRVAGTGQIEPVWVNRELLVTPASDTPVARYTYQVVGLPGAFCPPTRWSHFCRPEVPSSPAVANTGGDVSIACQAPASGVARSFRDEVVAMLRRRRPDPALPGAPGELIADRLLAVFGAGPRTDSLLRGLFSFSPVTWGDFSPAEIITIADIFGEQLTKVSADAANTFLHHLKRKEPLLHALVIKGLSPAEDRATETEPADTLIYARGIVSRLVGLPAWARDLYLYALKAHDEVLHAVVVRELSNLRDAVRRDQLVRRDDGPAS